MVDNCLPPIQMYAVLAAAVAVLAVSISNRVFSPTDGWFYRFSPLYPFGLILFHILFYIWTDRGKCESLFHLVVHVSTLVGLIAVGVAVYWKNMESRSGVDI